MAIHVVPVERIKATDAVQARASILHDTVIDFLDALKNGAQFPPITVFHDGAEYWLADGFTRFDAFKRNDETAIPCEVHDGGLREAMLFACGTNAEHGQRRTNADKRRVVERMLRDTEWRQWADREIARQCRVDHVTVGRIRAEVHGEITMNVADTATADPADEPRKHRRKGKTQSARRGRRKGTKKRAATTKAEPASVVALSDGAPLDETQAQAIAELQNFGWITTALLEMRERWKTLPLPGDAAAKFPRLHRHEIPIEQLRSMAQWLIAFADGLEQHDGGLHAA